MTTGQKACQGLPTLVTPAEAARALDLDVSTVRRLGRAGRIRWYRLGHRTVRIPREDLERLLDGPQTTPPRIGRRRTRVPRAPGEPRRSRGGAS